MTPEEALALAKTVSDIYGKATTDLLVLIARTLNQGMDRPGWATERLAEVTRLRANANRVVQAMQTYGVDATLSALEDAYRGGRLSPLTSPGLVAVNTRAVGALAADTIRVLDPAAPRVLRWTEDVYRQVVADVTASTVAGSKTRRQAAAEAVDRFATRGVTGFRDTAGRQWTMDTYTEMAVRTATGRAHRAGTLDRYAADGIDLVIVSDSPEECDLCRPYEGTILSISGAGGPTSLPDGLVYAGSLAAAEGNGLFHPNCTHRVDAYVPGLTRPHQQDTENPDGYAERQRQRELERRVRESKRRVAAAETIGDPTVTARQKELLRARQAALRDHVETTGRKGWVSRKRVNVTSR
jgi:hypothetical protein